MARLASGGGLQVVNALGVALAHSYAKDDVRNVDTQAYTPH